MTVEPTEAPEPNTDSHVDYGKGLAWTMGFNALMKVLLGGVAIYIARRLGQSEMGMFYLLANIYVFAEQMREAGLKQAFYNDNEVSPEKFRTYARLSVTSGLSFGLILSALAVPIAGFFNTPQLAPSVLWAALATLLNSLSVIPMAAIHKAGRFRDVGLIESSANLVAAGVSLSLVLAGWGFEALVAQLVVRAGLTFALAFWQKPFSVFHHDRAASRAIMRVCFPLVTTDLLWLVYSLADQFALVKILGKVHSIEMATASNGLYQQGRKILSIPSDFLFFPLFRTVMVALGNRNLNPERLTRTFMKALSLCVLFLVALYGVSAAMGKPVILALLGDKWAGSIPVFGIICLGEAFKTTGSFAGSSLVAAGKPHIPQFAWLIPYPIAAAGIALTWGHVSMMTIAWSYAAGMVAVNLVVITLAFKHLAVTRAQVKRFVECLAIAAAITGIAWAFARLPLDPWPMVLLAALVIPTVHGIIIGLVFAGRPFEYFSRAGVGKLRQAL